MTALIWHFSQWTYLAVIISFSKNERGGKRGLTTSGGGWVLKVIHVSTFILGVQARDRIVLIK